MSINQETSLEELASLVSQALEKAGIVATLSGGGAVTIYSANEYMSYDLDFITHAHIKLIEKALSPLGFVKMPKARHFQHPEACYLVEFPPGPLAFGELVVSDKDATTVDVGYGSLRIITPTQSVIDRLSAYVHWSDGQCLDQAVMIIKSHTVDWRAIESWLNAEGIDSGLLKRLRAK